MKTKNQPTSILLTLAAIFFTVALQAQPLTLSGTSYTQNFDNITTSGLPTEWSVRENNVSPTSLGTLAAFSADSGTDTWTASGGKFYDLAGVINNGTNFLGTENAATQAAATNRCLAVRVTAAFGDTNGVGVAFAVEIANTTGFGSFNLNLDFLLLNPQTRSNIWNVEYGIGSSPGSFVSVGTYTAATIAQGGVFGATHKSFSFGSALDNQPGPVWIRIANDTLITPPNLNSGGSGSRPLVGIDNFALTWTTVTTINPVAITTEPQNRTNNAGSTATFTVAATGTAPVYQWSQVVGGVTNTISDGQNADGSSFSGTGSPTLSVTGVLGAEAGTFVANVSNTVNSTNSTLATLTVIDPIISFPPNNQTNVVGDISYFDATAVGTQPMEIQWYYNGTLLSDIFQHDFTNQVFVYVTNGPAWTNLAGFYMVASNNFGSVTSSVATSTIPSTPFVLLSRWDFDATNSYPASAPLASIGTGVGSEVFPATTNLTNFLFVSGAIADPIDLNPSLFNSGWEVQDGPAQGTANKQLGFQYNTSTVGYNSIVLTWEERHSATASKYMRVQYSTDGSTFQDGPVITLNEVLYDFCSANLSNIPGINNNPNFAFRIVAEFESTAIGTANANYDGTTGTYGPGASGGTIRNDLMTVWGNPMLNISFDGTNAKLTWSAPGFVLQSAPFVTGPYTTIIGAASGYSTAATGTQKYFRLAPQ